MENTIPTDPAAGGGTGWEGAPVKQGGEAFIETPPPPPPPAPRADNPTYLNYTADPAGQQGLDTREFDPSAEVNPTTDEVNFFTAPLQTVRGWFGVDKKLESEAEIVPLGELRADDTRDSLLYGADETPPDPLDLDGGFFALAGVEDQGGTVRQFFTNPSLKQGKIVDRAPLDSKIEEGDILFRIENAEVDGRVIAAENALEEARDELPSALVEARAPDPESAKRRRPVARARARRGISRWDRRDRRGD